MPPPPPAATDPTISSFGSFETIESIKPSWKALCRHCDADADFVQHIVSKRAGFLRPHVLVSSIAGGVNGMLTGRVERRPWRFWQRRRTSPGQSVSALVIPRGGVFGAESPAVCKQFVTEIWQALRRGEFDVALFGGVEKGTPLYDAVRSIPPSLSCDHGLKHEIQWKAHLPDTLDEFLHRLSSPHRSAIRRKERKLEAAFPGQIHFRTFTQPTDVEELAAAASGIARQTYQYRRGGSYRSSREGRGFLELAARNQWLRGYVLYVGTRPIAFYISTLYQGCCRMDTTGYIAEYKDFEPGVVLFLHLVDDLCKHGVKVLDFGTGDSAFKSRFGDEKLEIATVCIFAPTVKSLLLMTAKCLRYSAERISRYAVALAGWERSLRRTWRIFPAAIRMKQILEVISACLVIIFLGAWQGWLKWPEGALLTAVLCALTSLHIARRMVAGHPPSS